MELEECKQRTYGPVPKSVMYPNLIIGGAAKAGTTSLYHYLRQHPDIYFPPLKEPDFLASAGWGDPINNINGPSKGLTVIRSWEDYEELYSKAEARYGGDASPSTLFYYSESIRRIKERLEDPRIILSLRNPVERAFSHYSFMLKDGLENLEFLEAIDHEAERADQDFYYGYQYQQAGFYADAVRAFQENFSKVKIILFEDLQSSTEQVLLDIYDFLDLENRTVPDLSVVYNPGGIPKSRKLYSFFRHKNAFRDFIRPLTNLFFSERAKHRIVERVNKLNLAGKPEMTEEAATKLRNVYREDILKLQDLINRDLSGWM